MSEGEALGQGLFSKVSEAEIREDIDIAIENYRLPEIHEIEEFILTYSKFFKDIKENKG